MRYADWISLVIDRLPFIAVAGVGLLLALIWRDRIGQAVAVLTAVGCGLLLLSSALLLPRLGYRSWMSDFDVPHQIDRIRDILDLTGLALIVAAVFVGRIGGTGGSGRHAGGAGRDRAPGNPRPADPGREQPSRPTERFDGR